MRYLYSILLIVILFASCKRDPKPSNALSEKAFINVLVDVHLAEAMFQERTRIGMDSLQSRSVYLSALKKNCVTEEQMLATTLYYSRHPRDYDKIFTEVLSQISAMMEEGNPKELKEKKAKK